MTCTLLGAVCCLWLSSAASRAEVFQLNDAFEAATLQSPWVIDNSPADVPNVTVQNSPVRAGNSAVHLINNYTDTGNAKLRTEMTAGNPGIIQWNKEYWVGFSFYLKNWTTSAYPEMVNQFHAVPHGWNWNNLSPRNITSILIQSGTLYLNVITQPNTGPATGGAEAVNVWSTSVQSNTWYDWVLHILPSQTTSGVIEVWCNGSLIYQQYGANVDPYDGAGQTAEPCHYLKCGVYNWPWGMGQHDVNQREIVYDEVKIGCVQSGYSSGYAGVAPAAQPAISFNSPDVFSAQFPAANWSGVGGASTTSLLTSPARLDVRAQQTTSDGTTLARSTLYSAPCADYNFLTHPRTITFSNVTSTFYTSGASYVEYLGIFSGQSGGVTAPSSGPNDGIYYSIDRVNAKLHVYQKYNGTGTELAAWNITNGAYSYTSMSLTLDGVHWSAAATDVNGANYTGSGTLSNTITTANWGSIFSLGLEANQAANNVARFDDLQLGSIIITPGGP